MSQDIFQARIDQLLEGLQGVIGIADELSFTAGRRLSMTEACGICCFGDCNMGLS